MFPLFPQYPQIRTHIKTQEVEHYGLSAVVHSRAFVSAIHYKSSLVPRCGLSVSIGQPVSFSNSVNLYLAFHPHFVKL